MKLNKKALTLFNIKKEIYVITICKLMAFFCFLFFSYNFINLLFIILNDNIKTEVIFSFALKTVGVLLCYYLFIYVDNKVSHFISAKVRNTLREKIYDKIKKLSLNYTEVVSTSNLLVMNSNSIISIELYFSKFIPQIYTTLAIFLSSLFILGYINIYLAIAIFFLYPLIPISIMVIVKKSKRVNKKTFKDFLSLSELFFDRIKGLTVAKIYNKTNNISKEIDKKSENYRKSTMTLLRHQLNSINVMDALTYISIVILSLIAIFNLTNNVLIIFIIVASFEFFRPLRMLGSLFHISMKATVELDNINKFLAYKEDKKNNDLNIDKLENIILNDVFFSYNNEENILKNINMTFKKSSATALVGESGSGKSTIIKLIMGLKKANRGTIKYGENKIIDIPFEKLTEIMTVISSESYLQKDTIRNHLKVNSKITEKEMYEALDKVNLKNFVLANGGLDYELTEGASNLSGGQKQRLLAAKAILKNSYIYILDEAVSNIDDYSKKCILDAFYKIKEDKIIIIISHDLEVLSNCDNIYVLEKGEILEWGTKDQLLKTPKLFSQLLNNQLVLKKEFLNKELE